MRCPQCSTEAAEDHAFCMSCGTPLGGQPKTTPTPPTDWAASKSLQRPQGQTIVNLPLRQPDPGSWPEQPSQQVEASPPLSASEAVNTSVPISPSQPISPGQPIATSQQVNVSSPISPSQALDAGQAVSEPPSGQQGTVGWPAPQPPGQPAYPPSQAGYPSQQWPAGPAQQGPAGPTQQWTPSPGQQWPGAPAQQWPGAPAVPAQQWSAGAAVPRPAGLASAGAGLRIAGGLGAIGAAIFIIVTCLLPVNLPTGSGPAGIFSAASFDSSLIGIAWNSASPSSLWYVAEPVGVAVLVIVAAIMILAAGRKPGRRLLLGGMLVAFGLQTLLFSGGLRVAFSGSQAGSAGIVGIFAALLLVAAGVLSAASGRSGRAGTDNQRPAGLV